MPMPHRLCSALLACMLACPASAQPFLNSAQVDYTRLLAPAPLTGSPQQQEEMAELERLEQTRTPERTAQARADIDESVYVMFGAVMGPAFTPAALPLATRLFERLGDTEEALNTIPKASFARMRPFLANPGLHPAVPPSRSGSYPSGHSTRSTLLGVILAAIVPERRAAIYARMQDYAESRLIAGMHYRSDITAGRIAGTATAAVLFNDAVFMTAFAPARDEIRTALGLDR